MTSSGYFLPFGYREFKSSLLMVGLQYSQRCTRLLKVTVKFFSILIKLVRVAMVESIIIGHAGKVFSKQEGENIFTQLLIL